MILMRTMGGERKVAGSRQETGACPAFCAACLGTRQCTAGPPALPSLPNDTVCHNHTQARITASSGVKSASLHLILFVEALLM